MVQYCLVWFCCADFLLVHHGYLTVLFQPASSQVQPNAPSRHATAAATSGSSGLAASHAAQGRVQLSDLQKALQSASGIVAGTGYKVCLFDCNFQS